MDRYELYHHGVKDQKKGVRRYQYEDGSLTPLGKIHYAKMRLAKAAEERKAKKTEERDRREREKTSKKERKKPVSRLTDAELNERIARLEKEKRYKDLLKDVNAPVVSKGQSFVSEIVSQSAKNIGTQTVTYLMGVGVNKALEKYFGPGAINPKKGQKDK